MQNTQIPIVVLERVKENLEKSYISSETKVLLAISGGVDSVVLCDLLLKLGIPFALAHCNFSLRAEDSDADQQLVEELAEKFDIPLHLIQFDTKKEARIRGESIQLVARELRYEWFNSLKKEFEYETLLTAHHLNDRVETALINLSRGTGISGLRSIKLLSEGIARPLCTVTKDELYAYAKKNQLSWREDKSNEDNKYARNLVRNEVVPLLENLNPSFVEHSASTFERLSDTESIYKEAIEQKINTIKSGDKIDVKGLKSLTGAKQILYEIISSYGFSYAQAGQVFETLDHISGKIFSSKSHQLIIDRANIYIQEIEENVLEPTSFCWKEDSEVSFAGMSFSFHEVVQPKSLLTDEGTVNLSLKNLSDNLLFRKWQIGDKISPFGMRGKQKKVSDILIDKKVPLHEKENVLILESEGELVWVVGYCFSDKFSVQKSDDKICQVKRIK